MGDDDRRGGLPSRNRRRLLLALGFGAVNAAGLAQLSRAPRPGSPPDPASLLTPAAAAGEAAAPVDPPVLEGAAEQPGSGHTYDVVIGGGRVMDPESGYDAIADVGIDGATVTAISAEGLQGRRRIDATDRVVAPGFIDILSYEPADYGIWYKIAEGVTTNLGMHGINADASAFFRRFADEGSPCHYGGAYDNPFHRSSRFDIGIGDAATAAQISAMADDVRQQLADGWIGIDLEPEYTPGITAAEMQALAAVGAEVGAATYFHGRYSTDVPPGTNADTLREILDVARATGAAVHVEHLISTGGTFTMRASLDTLEAARDEGIDVTACMYPYDFWATTLASARFNDGWMERFHISYDDLQVPGTGQRVSAATFDSLQADNVLVAAYAIPHADVLTCLQSPLVMVGSDAILEPGDNNHPRATGCFARLFGRYVRDQGAIDLMDALAKVTIMPAQRVQGAAPAMARKGRLQRGADADVVVFDPRTIADRSTVDDPAQAAVGVDHVLVLGQVVRTPDGDDRDVRPGQPITGAPV